MTTEQVDFLPFFHQLGTSIEAKYRKANYQTESLAKIAAEELSHVQPFPVEWLFEQLCFVDYLPHQVDLHSRFGEPPVTVFDNGNLYLDFLVWRKNKTTIHAHAFGGAFQVWHGATVQPTYEFHCNHVVGSHLQIGDLHRKNLQVLKAGDVTEISPGSQLIHSSLHIDVPTITLVVRNRADNALKPQFNYYPPHFAIDPDFVLPISKRKLELAEVVLQTGIVPSLQLLQRMMKDADALCCFRLLELAYRECGEESPEFCTLLEIASDVHSEIAPFVLPTLREQLRFDLLLGAFQRTEERASRLALLLMIGGADSEQLSAILADEFPNASPAAVLKSLLKPEALVNHERIDGSGQSRPGPEVPKFVRNQLLRPLFTAGSAWNGDSPSPTECPLLQQN